jgi:hypothetical protein
MDQIGEEGVGSVLTSKDHKGGDENKNRKGEVEGEIEVDPFIGPTLRQDPAGSTVDAIGNAVEFGAELLYRTGAVDLIKEAVNKVGKIENKTDTVSAKAVLFKDGKAYKLDSVKNSDGSFQIIKRQIDLDGNIINNSN